MRCIRFALIVLAGLGLSCCVSLREVEFTGIKGFSVQNISTEGIEGDLLLGIRNPNKFGFTIYKSEFDVSFSGIHLGKAQLTKRVRIKAGEESTYRFRLRNDFKNVNLAEVLRLLNGATRRDLIEVKGDLKAGRMFLKRSFPVDLKEKISLK
jgi:LEA14-like dessication related protein